MAESVSGTSDPERVRAAVGKIIASPPFIRSSRLQRFLQYIVEARLRGDEDAIQEYTIGLKVFDRGEQFDPRSDSIVRTEAYRLRQRLEKYYATAGADDSTRIALPARGYVPVFGLRTHRWRASAKVLIPLALAAALVIFLASRRGPHQPDPEAAAAFEKGQAAWQQWTATGAEQAETYFEQAIAIDPQWPLPHAWLTRACIQRCTMGDSNHAVLYAKALAAAKRSVELDPTLPAGQHAVAAASTFLPDWDAAQRSYERAVDLDPSNPFTREAYAITFLVPIGELQKAEAEIREAVRLAPGSTGFRVILGKILYFRGRNAEAMRVLEEVLAIDPLYPDAQRNLAAVLQEVGEAEQAIRLYERAQDDAYLTWGDGLLANALATAGHPDRARAVLKELLAARETSYVSELAIATAFVGLGDLDAAFDWLERSWDRRELRIRYVAVDPIYRPVHGDPRFSALLAKMRLPRRASLTR